MAATLADSPDDTPATRDELARAYFVVASITAEVGSKEDALAAFQKLRAILEGLLRKARRRIAPEAPGPLPPSPRQPLTIDRPAR